MASSTASAKLRCTCSPAQKLSGRSALLAPCWMLRATSTIVHLQNPICLLLPWIIIHMHRTVVGQSGCMLRFLWRRLMEGATPILFCRFSLTDEYRRQTSQTSRILDLTNRARISRRIACERKVLIRLESSYHSIYRR